MEISRGHLRLRRSEAAKAASSFRRGGVILGVIPARYGSARFPGKVLARLNGKPLIQVVWERVSAAKRLNRLLVATDHPKVIKVVEQFGGEALLTGENLNSGTDRVWAAAKGLDAQIIINIQGDEPLVTPTLVDRLAEAMQEDQKVQMATLRYPMKGLRGYTDPNVVKVVTDTQGWALYFSRSPLPAVRGEHQSPSVWYKHIGVYGYRRKCLQQFVRWPVSSLEAAEKLEQLRALEHGVRIRVLDSPVDTIGVDTLEDLRRVELVLKDA
ncbi:MAG: 3-deoxy-manno-octulosonate cytidylyltransferase [Candidatus Omnitrophica bacterium]|nr:3-deoxy-manno-octulosonate cytidylyltransferase [Candidatus Omnitrophota bacterium]